MPTLIKNGDIDPTLLPSQNAFEQAKKRINMIHGIYSKVAPQSSILTGLETLNDTITLFEKMVRPDEEINKQTAPIVEAKPISTTREGASKQTISFDALFQNAIKEKYNVSTFINNGIPLFVYNKITSKNQLMNLDNVENQQENMLVITKQEDKIADIALSVTNFSHQEHRFQCLYLKISKSGAGDLVNGCYFPDKKRLKSYLKVLKENDVSEIKIDFETSSWCRDPFFSAGLVNISTHNMQSPPCLIRKNDGTWFITFRDKHGNTCFPYAFAPKHPEQKAPHWSEFEKGKWTSLAKYYDPPPKVELCNELQNRSEHSSTTMDTTVSVKVETIGGDVWDLHNIDLQKNLKEQIAERVQVIDTTEDFILQAQPRKYAVAVFTRTKNECDPHELPIRAGETLEIISAPDTDDKGSNILICENSHKIQGIVYPSYIISSFYADNKENECYTDRATTFPVFPIQMGTVNVLRFSLFFRSKITIFVMTRESAKKSWKSTPISITTDDTDTEYLGRKLNGILSKLTGEYPPCKFLLYEKDKKIIPAGLDKDTILLLAGINKGLQNKAEKLQLEEFKLRHAVALKELHLFDGSKFFVYRVHAKRFGLSNNRSMVIYGKEAGKINTISKWPSKLLVSRVGNVAKKKKAGGSFFHRYQN